MAKQNNPAQAAQAALKNEKKLIQEEKKKFKAEQKQQKKEAKKRAKEIAKREDEILDVEDGGGGFATFFAIILIVFVWLAVVAVVIKLDVGGFGSGVLTPLLKDVPVINQILPGNPMSQTSEEENYGGYTNLRDAVNQIRALEIEIDQLQANKTTQGEEVTNLQAEVARLKEFEEKQIEFQRIKTEFYQEVVYAENGPGAEAYAKYFESMDASTAEYIYRQVVAQQQESAKVKEYAATYSQMKPKQAATIFEAMTDNLDLVSRILSAMSTEDKASILGVMDSELAARLTKLMEPDS